MALDENDRRQIVGIAQLEVTLTNVMMHVDACEDPRALQLLKRRLRPVLTGHRITIKLRHSEVDELDHTRRMPLEEDVARLDVAVDNVVGMYELNRVELRHESK